MARRRFPGLPCIVAFATLFITQVFAASAVLGVDLGTEYIKAALIKPGVPLEIVLTKDSRRKETSAVAFKPSKDKSKAVAHPERAYGSDAVALAPRFPGDVYANLKTLLGLPIDDPVTEEYASRNPALSLEPVESRNTVAFKSQAFNNDGESWMIEELLAMELRNIRSNAEAAAGPSFSVSSVVLTIPPFYTVEEKRALLLAAEMAGLKVLSLIGEGLAVGLHYATSRQFPNINEGAKPEYHMVFDMGAGSTTATIIKFQSRTVKDVGKFNKTVQEVQVLGTGWDRTLGGKSLDGLLIDDMVAKFVASDEAKRVGATGESVQTNGRAMAKIKKEALKARHILSANTNTRVSIESLFEDIDFKYAITRTEFEDMAEGYPGRVAEVIKSALRMANLNAADLESIILHGGGSRIPFVQKTLDGIAGSPDKIRTNVNSDEAGVFGAAFRAADISPSFRVKEIRASDIATYPAGYRWINARGASHRQPLWTSTSQLGAVPKEVTFTNQEDFEITFYQEVGTVEKDTMTMGTKNLTATVAMLKEQHGCSDDEIKFKVSFKLNGENGEVQATRAAVECEVEDKGNIVDGVKNLFGFGKKDQQPLADEDGSEPEVVEPASAASSSTEGSATSASSSVEPEASAKAVEKEAKKRLVSIPVAFSLEKAGLPVPSKGDIKKSVDRLNTFDASDRLRFQTEESRNKLEGFTYRIRDLLESDSFTAVALPDELATLKTKSEETSQWLYEDGVDAPKTQFDQRLKALKDLVKPIQTRVEEGANRPAAVSGLRSALEETKSFVDTIRKEIVEYEEWHASKSASSADPSSTTATPSASSGGGDFDGLEDDEPAVDSSETQEARTPADVGPVPPVYEVEDLTTVEKLWAEMSTWLEEAVAKQDALPATADPVLLVKDITSRREKLDKAGVDLAMKGVKNFESRKKKAASSSSSSSRTSTKTKTSSSSSSTSAEEAPTPKKEHDEL